MKMRWESAHIQLRMSSSQMIIRHLKEKCRCRWQQRTHFALSQSMQMRKTFDLIRSRVMRKEKINRNENENRWLCSFSFFCMCTCSACITSLIVEILLTILVVVAGKSDERCIFMRHFQHMNAILFSFVCFSIFNRWKRKKLMKNQEGNEYPSLVRRFAWCITPDVNAM